VKVLFVYSGNSETGQNIIVENQARSLIENGIRTELFPVKGKGLRGYLKNLPKLSNLLKNNNFDIVHAHYGLSGLLSFCSKRKERLIVSFMGSDLLFPVVNQKRKLKSGLLIRINILFSRFFYDYAIVKSKEMGEIFLPKTKYAVIPNGIFLEHFNYCDQTEARKKLGINKEKKIVVFMSNPSRFEKNYSLAVETIKYLNHESVELVSVFNETHDTLPLYYNSADLLLLTSLTEGSPNVVKEAMACGCPVVSTKVGDVGYLFGDTPGYYLTSSDPTEIAKSVINAINFRKKYRKTDGRKRMELLGLDSDTIARKIITLYESLLEN
jgi:teichuronic acid biosynthesis glycosyltransferase TuaC